MNYSNMDSIGPDNTSLAGRKEPVRKSTLAKNLLIAGENTREFEEFRKNLLVELCPSTKVQEMLAEKIIVCGWRLHRAMVVEKHLLNRQNAITEEERGGSFGEDPVRRRIRNIKKVDLASDEARYLAQQQIELQKIMNKTLERLRGEQRTKSK